MAITVLLKEILYIEILIARRISFFIWCCYDFDSGELPMHLSIE